VFTDPPNTNDATSLNRFINEAYIRRRRHAVAARQRRPQRHAPVRWGWSGGVSHRFTGPPSGPSSTGRATSASPSSSAPARAASRGTCAAGLEHPLGHVLKGRLGYQYRSVDEDDFTAGNEYLANAISMGLGYAPEGATWVLESGYRIEFRSQDYNDPGRRAAEPQNLGIEILWKF
jgi:hypothetical protein